MSQQGASQEGAARRRQPSRNAQACAGRRSSRSAAEGEPTQTGSTLQPAGHTPAYSAAVLCRPEQAPSMRRMRPRPAGAPPACCPLPSPIFFTVTGLRPAAGGEGKTDGREVSSQAQSQLWMQGGAA